MYLIMLLVVVAAVAACNGGKEKAKGDVEVVMQDSVDSHGLQRMQESTGEMDFQYKGKDYHSVVIRTPDEELPHITNEMGDTYVDNKITLRLTRGGEQVFNRTFTKSDFASVVDASLMKKAVLEGIVYDKTAPEGIIYAASVAQPQTDLYVPLSITITADGHMSIAKVDNLEEQSPDDKSN